MQEKKPNCLQFANLTITQIFWLVWNFVALVGLSRVKILEESNLNLNFEGLFG